MLYLDYTLFAFIMLQQRRFVHSLRNSVCVTKQFTPYETRVILIQG